MNAMMKTFPLQHGKRLQHSAARSILRDTGVGLAVGLTVLVLAIVQVGVNSGGQTTTAWPGAAEPGALTVWENPGLPDRLPVDPLISDARL